MSEEDQSLAIGRAIQAADASAKRLHALAAQIHDSRERLEDARRALKEVIFPSSDMHTGEVATAIRRIPDKGKLLELVSEYEEQSKLNPSLQERAKALRGLA
jgi:hypothetical protein